MTPYLIIGNGRVARHFQHYFSLLNIPFKHWARLKPSQEGHLDAMSNEANERLLKETTLTCERVLLLISDPAIDEFINARPYLRERILIHFSGSLVSRHARSAHPLMTFTQSFYDLRTYQDIPFVLERGRGDFPELLPGLSNPHYFIESEQKPLYHGLCVMSGNFTTLLWDKVFRAFEESLGLPREMAYPYLQQVAKNLQDPSIPALTGPIARRDFKTINKHLQVLRDDPYAEVYRAFVKAAGLKLEDGSP